MSDSQIGTVISFEVEANYNTLNTNDVLTYETKLHKKLFKDKISQELFPVMMSQNKFFLLIKVADFLRV